MKTIIFGAGLPRSATRSLAFFLKDVCGFSRAKHEPLRSLNKIDLDFKVKGIQDYFDKYPERNHWVDVDWNNSYMMSGLQEAFPQAKWIIMHRPKDEVVKSVMTWNPMRWSVASAGRLYDDIWLNVCTQLSDLPDWILLNFASFVGGYENDRIVEFVGRDNGHKTPEEVLARRYNNSDYINFTGGLYHLGPGHPSTRLRGKGKLTVK